MFTRMFTGEGERGEEGEEEMTLKSPFDNQLTRIDGVVNGSTIRTNDRGRPSVRPSVQREFIPILSAMADRSFSSPDVPLESMDTSQAQSQSQTNEFQSTRLRYVDEYLHIYYKKQLDASMISRTKEIIENLLSLYENFDDETANSYVLSFLLLRVGCVAKTYDFEAFLDSTRAERDQLVKHNWSGEKVLMRIRRKDDQLEKNFPRFDAFFSSWASIRSDDLLRSNEQTNLKKLLQLLVDETQSTLIEYRFTVLLALQSMLRGLIVTVTHSRRNRPGKISPFIGQKDAEKIFDYVSSVINQAVVPRLTDSEEVISELAHQTLNELIEIWPNSWTTKSMFDQLFYSIVSQEEKSSFENSIDIFHRLLNHRDYEKERNESFFEYLLSSLSSEQFQIASATNFISIFKLLNDIFTVYPEHFSLKLICHWSSGIFDENVRLAKLSMSFYVRFVQLSEDQLGSSLLWAYFIQLEQTLFQNSISEEVTARLIHSIENNRHISSLLGQVTALEHFISVEQLQQNSSAKNVILCQLIRSLFIYHLNRQRNAATDDEDDLLHQLSRISLRSLTFLLQQSDMAKDLLIECFLGFQTTFSFLEAKEIEENSLSFDQLINLFQVHLTTHQLAETNI